MGNFIVNYNYHAYDVKLNTKIGPRTSQTDFSKYLPKNVHTFTPGQGKKRAWVITAKLLKQKSKGEISIDDL